MAPSFEFVESSTLAIRIFVFWSVEFLGPELGVGLRVGLEFESSLRFVVLWIYYWFGDYGFWEWWEMWLVRRNSFGSVFEFFKCFFLWGFEGWWGEREGSPISDRSSDLSSDFRSFRNSPQKPRDSDWTTSATSRSRFPSCMKLSISFSKKLTLFSTLKSRSSKISKLFRMDSKSLVMKPTFFSRFSTLKLFLLFWLTLSSRKLRYCLSGGFLNCAELDVWGRSTEDARFSY